VQLEHELVEVTEPPAATLITAPINGPDIVTTAPNCALMVGVLAVPEIVSDPLTVNVQPSVYAFTATVDAEKTSKVPSR
jgi:hypothetical protein